jgi:AcrR family transcriptional regulator
MSGRETAGAGRNNTAGAGRPRRVDVDRKLLASTLAVLSVKGPRGVTVEAVAADSGVAKTTIYRRYRDRRHLLAAALEQVADLPMPDADLQVRERLIVFLEQFREGLVGSLGLRTAAALLSEQDDPEFAAAARRHVLAPRLQQILQIFDDGVSGGYLRPDIDYRRATDLLIGSYLARTAFDGTVDADWSASVVDLVLRATLAD